MSKKISDSQRIENAMVRMEESMTSLMSHAKDFCGVDTTYRTENLLRSARRYAASVRALARLKP